MISIDSLIKAIPANDAFDWLLGALERINIPARSWRVGSVAKSIVGVVAQVGSMGLSLVSSAVAGGYISTAQGEWLKARASDVFGVDFFPATFAAGSKALRLTNAGGAIYTFGADEFLVKSSLTNKQYRVSQAFVLPSNSTIDVDVTAIEAGAASSAGVGEIDTLVSTLNRVSCTNTIALVGNDEESPENLRSRAIATKATWSVYGPRDAYDAAARNATMPDGTPAGITRTRILRSAGQVIVICATATGAPTDEQLAAVAQSIEVLARPDGVTATAVGAEQQETSHTLTIWTRSGSRDAIISRAQIAMANFISTYPIGGVSLYQGGQGYLFGDAIRAAVLGDLRINGFFDVIKMVFEGQEDIPIDPNSVAVNTSIFFVSFSPS